MHITSCFLIAAALSLATSSCRAETVRMDQIDLGTMTCGWGKPQKNLSVTQSPLTIAKVKYEHGVGVHARSELWLQLDGHAKAFTAKVGVDDAAREPRGALALEFIVIGDTRELWRSGACKLGEPPHECHVDLTGISTVTLIFDNAGGSPHFDYGDWVDASFEYDGAAPVPVPPKGKDTTVGTSTPANQPGNHETKTAIPIVDGDYVLIYKPQPDVYSGKDTKNYKTGATYTNWQPNDHTFIKGPDNCWHLFGITRPNDVLNDGTHEGEQWCFHAVAPAGTLEQAMRPMVWIDKPKIDVAGCGWAPIAVKIGDTYSLIGSSLGRAESKNLYNWEDKGKLGVQCGNRDSDILIFNDTYYLIRCNNNGVCMATSTDFVHWSKSQEIFKPVQGHGSWQCESPTMVHYGDKFYLFWCLWDSSGSGPDDPPLPSLYKGENPSVYNYRTYVYASDTPTDFNNRAPIAELKAHAPEIIRDEKGNWFISSADYPQRGISLARMSWK